MNEAQWLAFDQPMHLQTFPTLQDSPRKRRLLAEACPDVARIANVEQCQIIRDLVGNPFRPVVIQSSWLEWNRGTIPKIARTIYEERRFAELGVLGDALEEAGCRNEEVLAHCRGAGPHVLGCWLLDLILQQG